MHNIDQFIEFSEDIKPLRERKQAHLQEAVFISRLREGRWIPARKFSEIYLYECTCEDERGDWPDLREAIIKLQDLEEQIFSPSFANNRNKTALLEQYYLTSVFKDRQRLTESQLDESLNNRRQELNQIREQHLKEFIPWIYNWYKNRQYQNAANKQLGAGLQNVNIATMSPIGRTLMQLGGNPFQIKMAENILKQSYEQGAQIKDLLGDEGWFFKENKYGFTSQHKQAILEADQKQKTTGVPAYQGPQQQQPVEQQSQQNNANDEQIIKDVWAGKYGNGQARKQALDQQFGPGTYERIQKQITASAQGQQQLQQGQQAAQQQAQTQSQGAQQQDQQGQEQPTQPAQNGQEEQNQQEQQQLTSGERNSQRNNKYRIREKRLQEQQHDINELITKIRKGKMFLVDKYSEALLEDAALYCKEEEWPIIREAIIHLEDLEEQIFNDKDFYLKKSSNRILEEYFNIAAFNNVQNRLQESYSFKELNERREQLDIDLCNIYALREEDATAAEQGESPSFAGRMASTLLPGAMVSSALRKDGYLHRFMPFARNSAAAAPRPGLLNGIGNTIKGWFGGGGGQAVQAAGQQAGNTVAQAVGNQAVGLVDDAAGLVAKGAPGALQTAAQAGATAAKAPGLLAGVGAKVAPIAAKVGAVAGPAALGLAAAGGAFLGVDKLINYFSDKADKKDADARKAAHPAATDNHQTLMQKAYAWKNTMGNDPLPWSLSNAMETVKEAEKRGYKGIRLQEAIPALALAPLIGAGVGAIGAGLKKGWNVFSDWWNSKQVDDSPNAVMSAKPKDFVRKAGEKIKLSQADIDYAKQAAAGQGAGSQTQSQANQQAAANPADANWTAPEKVTDPNQLGQQIIDGKWGNDPDRTRRLQANGYDAQMIQGAKQYVNTKLGARANQPIQTPEDRSAAAAKAATNPESVAKNQTEEKLIAQGIPEQQANTLTDLVNEVAKDPSAAQKPEFAQRLQKAGVSQQLFNQALQLYQSGMQTANAQAQQKIAALEAQIKQLETQKASTPEGKAENVEASKQAAAEAGIPQEITQQAETVQSNSEIDKMKAATANLPNGQELYNKWLEAYNKEISSKEKAENYANKSKDLETALASVDAKTKEAVKTIAKEIEGVGCKDADVTKVKEVLESTPYFKNGTITKVDPFDGGASEVGVKLTFKNGLIKTLYKSGFWGMGGTWKLTDDSGTVAGSDIATAEQDKLMYDQMHTEATKSAETAAQERAAHEKEIEGAGKAHEMSQNLGFKRHERESLTHESINSLVNYYYKHLN